MYSNARSRSSPAPLVSYCQNLESFTDACIWSSYLTYLPTAYTTLFLYFEWEVYIIKYVMYKKPLNPANMHHEIRASFGFWLAS